MTDCRDCKDYRECPYGTGLEYYHYGQIRFCPFQCLWIIANSGILEGGDWPKDPDNLDSNSGQRNLKAEARFTRPVIILAEVTYRLGRAGIQGKLLVAQVEAGREFDDLDRDARDALMYVKGFKRKRDSFMDWRRKGEWKRKRRKTSPKQTPDKCKLGIHEFVLNENSLGRCKHCPATKQFPVEKRLKLRPSEIIAMENLGSIVNCDPGSPFNASVYGVELDKDY